MDEQYQDSYELEHPPQPVEHLQPSDHALAHWRESFDEMEKPTDGHWSDKTLEGVTEGFKHSSQMYALTFDPTGMAALAAGIAAELLGHALEKSSEHIRNMRDSDNPSDRELQETDRKLTQAIANRDQTAVRGALETVMHFPR